MTMDAGKQIAADDWTDQDLLTKDEARERLAQEIKSESAALAALGSDPGAQAEAQLRQRRLAALKTALTHL
jgi:hypothetical protein